MNISLNKPTRYIFSDNCIELKTSEVHHCKEHTRDSSYNRISFQRIWAIFGQLSPSGARQLSIKSLQPDIAMCWREHGRSGNDDMSGHNQMFSLFKLDRQFRFLGRDFMSHASNDSSSTDENFADSSKSKDWSFQYCRLRSAGTVKLSDESIWLSNTELPIVRALWTRNCETHSAVSFGTSLK
jgi:hypothetical protein